MEILELWSLARLGLAWRNACLIFLTVQLVVLALSSIGPQSLLCFKYRTRHLLVCANDIQAVECIKGKEFNGALDFSSFGAFHTNVRSTRGEWKLEISGTQATSGVLPAPFRALLALKERVSDISNSLSTWDAANTNFSSWAGLKLNINADSSALPKEIKITGLSFPLGQISVLSRPEFAQSLPPEMGLLTDLVSLDLSPMGLHLQAGLRGSLPSQLSLCSKLTFLRLGRGFLSGPLPTFISSLPLLQVLDISQNNFSGPVPTWLASLSHLSELSLSQNSFHGVIPSEIGSLSNLQSLDLSTNGLLGSPVPKAISLLTALSMLDLSSNSFSGPLPPWLFLMPSLVNVFFYNNKFSGPFPSHFSDPLSLQTLELSNNNFSNESLSAQTISTLCRAAPSLTSLGLVETGLLGIIPEELALCSSLRILYLSGNRLSGVIPSALPPQLEAVDLSGNDLSGTIPSTMSCIPRIFLDNNRLSGPIPAFNCSSPCGTESLSIFSAANNMLSGPIPPGLDASCYLEIFNVSGNQFQGSLPSSLLLAASLSVLDVSRNFFSGRIHLPEDCSTANSLVYGHNSFSGWFPWDELEKCVSLQVLDISHNNLSGHISYSPVSLVPVRKFDMSANMFSGFIPDMFSRFAFLTSLDMSRNMFDGSIPPSLADLVHIRDLNLSWNHLSGPVPRAMATPQHVKFLRSLDLSHNQLRGRIPSGFRKAESGSFFDFSGNNLKGSSLDGVLWAGMMSSLCGLCGYRQCGLVVPGSLNYFQYTLIALSLIFFGVGIRIAISCITHRRIGPSEESLLGQN